MSIYTSSSALSSPRIRAKARASGRNVCAPGKRRAGRVKRRLRGTRKYGREVGRGAWLVEYRKKREREGGRVARKRKREGEGKYKERREKVYVGCEEENNRS